jgi:fatty acid desaturase
MLRNSADRRSIGLLIVILGLEISAIVFFDSMPMLLLVPVLFVLTIAVFTATLINHNHRHVATFDRPWANRIFNYVLSMAMGAPSTRLHMVHMLNHHKSYRTTEDWSHYSLAIRMTAEDRQQLRIEYGFFFAWVFAWLTYDFSAAAIVLAIGYLGGQFILLIGNLINHDQCDLGSPYNLARNFHSRIENWIFLNHGYHTVHHRRTTLHWSKLRAVHDSHFRDKCDPALQNRSFLAYFFRHYLLS